MSDKKKGKNMNKSKDFVVNLSDFDIEKDVDINDLLRIVSTKTCDKISQVILKSVGDRASQIKIKPTITGFKNLCDNNLPCYLRFKIHLESADPTLLQELDFSLI